MILAYGIQGESLNDTMQPCHDMELGIPQASIQGLQGDLESISIPVEPLWSKFQVLESKQWSQWLPNEVGTN